MTNRVIRLSVLLVCGAFVLNSCIAYCLPRHTKKNQGTCNEARAKMQIVSVGRTDRCFPNLPVKVRKPYAVNSVVLLKVAPRLRTIVDWVEAEFMPEGIVMYNSLPVEDLDPTFFVVTYESGSGLYIWNYLLYVLDTRSNEFHWRLVCMGPILSSEKAIAFDSIYIDSKTVSLVFANRKAGILRRVSIAQPLRAMTIKYSRGNVHSLKR